ncbi:hypothetical protein GCM10010885_03300 [Alicyclobacillus cellulosilyticus]|uniref:Ger(X)C family germination protein n=1 Tax=Alicyclobacillus cellulosilyticus TaxID=1003997 RepID=A0A917NFF0_9BACL|nr:Ger(x)C family spore germination protein [Alicyclobacillus cellulosilyticus]GGI97058.1 hypothetical protein GCM10010885_03300 [Alicyclobacillus cellulosilyticus]
MMRCRFAAWAAAACLAALCTGCFDRKELEQQAFVTSLGIDEAPQGQVDCTLRIALPQSNNGGTGGGGGGGAGGKEPLAGSGPVTYRARSVIEALNLANTSIERTLSLSHLTDVRFGASLAQRGIARHLRPLLRFREFRRTIYVFISRTTAREEMQAETPVVEKTPTRVADDIDLLSKYNGLMVEMARLHDFTNALDAGHEGALLPLFAVNREVAADPAGKQGVQADRTSYVAGHVARAGGNPVEWAGAAVFRGDKMVGYLDGRETTLLRLLRGTIKHAKFELADPLAHRGLLSLSLNREHRPRYHVRLGQPLVMVIDVPLEADLLNMDAGYNLQGPRQLARLDASLSREVSQEMRRVVEKLFRQYGVDPIPVARAARSQFATHAAFAAYPWEARLRDAQVTVRADVHVRRFGVQIAQAESRV